MKTIEVTSPLDGSRIGSVDVADPNAVDAAVDRARRAFESWSVTPVKERVQALFRFKHLVEKQIGEISEIVSSESGKTVAEAKAGIEKGLEVVEYATALPIVGQGSRLEVSRGVDCYSRSYPLGVVAGITPFNFPAMVPLWMFPLAIAAGNTFLLKPSEQVPLTPIRLAEIFADAGASAGCVPDCAGRTGDGGIDNRPFRHCGGSLRRLHENRKTGLRTRDRRRQADAVSGRGKEPSCRGSRRRP